MRCLPLTIVLPNYNHAHFLPMAIESVLAQHFADFELLIVDDGSSDDSVDLIQCYVQKDRRVKFIRHPQNLGIAAACNTALKQAQGVYLHGLSATDCYLPHFLERSMNALLAHPEIGICCTDVAQFEDDPMQFVRHSLIPEVKHPILLSPEVIPRVYKYARLCIPGLCAIVKKNSFVAYGGYLPQLHFMCDWFVNHCIALFEGAIYIPEALIVFREPGYSKMSSQIPAIRQEALNHLLDLLLDPKQHEVLSRMKRSATLGILAKERIKNILVHPKLWNLYFFLAQRHLYPKFWPRIKQSALNQASPLSTQNEISGL